MLAVVITRWTFEIWAVTPIKICRQLVDQTVGKMLETSYRVEIHFSVFDHLYHLFSSVKLVET